MDNLCNYFILPLLGLNKLSYGKGKFINSYLTERFDVVVELTEDIDPSVYIVHPQYATDLNWEEKVLVVYAMPDEFLDDCHLFSQGKYSRMSEKAKKLIKDNSGLIYYQKIAPDRVQSDPKLLALDRNKDLREMMQERLQVKIDPEAELLDMPHENNFHKFL